MSCSSIRLESKDDEYSQVRLRRSDEWLGSKQEPAGLCGDNENIKPIRGTLYSVDCWPSILEVLKITTNATRKTKIGHKQENEPSADQPSQPASDHCDTREAQTLFSDVWSFLWPLLRVLCSSLLSTLSCCLLQQSHCLHTALLLLRFCSRNIYKHLLVSFRNKSTFINIFKATKH